MQIGTTFLLVTFLEYTTFFMQILQVTMTKADLPNKLSLNNFREISDRKNIWNLEGRRKLIECSKFTFNLFKLSFVALSFSKVSRKVTNSCSTEHQSSISNNRHVWEDDVQVEI